MSLQDFLIKFIVNLIVALAIFLAIGLLAEQVMPDGHSMLSVWQFWVMIAAYPVIRSVLNLTQSFR